MNYLLDTHAFLWFIDDSTALSKTARHLIEDADNNLYLSTASIWEIAIKISLGKLSMPTPFANFVGQQLLTNAIETLEIRITHAEIVTRLPFQHRDPFDRLIIAQSLSEDITIIGRDAIFDAYGIVRYW
jgi:PIN domain nuclease of toxin-antitoxin system